MQLGCTVAVALLSLASCEHQSEPRDGSGPRGSTSAMAADEVSRVYGDPILLGDVDRYQGATGLAPLEVLRRLQARKVLVHEARRRGIQLDGGLQLAQRKALVQSLLASHVEALPIDEAALRAAYESRAAKFRPSERRASVHILIKIAKEAPGSERRAAERIARLAMGWLSQHSFEEATKRAQQVGKARGFEVKAEEVPKTGRDGQLQKEYLTALFETPVDTVVPHVVQTRFGFHAIKVTGASQPPVTEFDDARPELLSELQLKQRRAALSDLLQNLEHNGRVVRNTDALAVLAGISL